MELLNACIALWAGHRFFFKSSNVDIVEHDTIRENNFSLAETAPSSINERSGNDHDSAEIINIREITQTPTKNQIIPNQKHTKSMNASNDITSNGTNFINNRTWIQIRSATSCNLLRQLR